MHVGVTDLYKSQSTVDEVAIARSNPVLLQITPSTQESVVFRGRKLYRRGHKLGSGAYATVLIDFTLCTVGSDVVMWLDRCMHASDKMESDSQ
jgi:hypothetical protein